jgi:ElaB/YqjD/DUF883 family membrane-anchored ribosome-binding protein|tara:strand:+ start:444 stop:647 length:204 start_codon:yes stop_codon:yes gene_type:complete
MSFFSWLKKLFTEPVIKEKTEAVVEEVKNTVSEGIDEIKTRRERARDNKGRFVADDPDTEKNEAYKD